MAGIMYIDILENMEIRQDEHVKIEMVSEKGVKHGIRKAKVVAVYPHVVLLDFGKYKETRKKVDIFLKLNGVLGRG